MLWAAAFSAPWIDEIPRLRLNRTAMFTPSLRLMIIEAVPFDEESMGYVWTFVPQIPRLESGIGEDSFVR